MSHPLPPPTGYPYLDEGRAGGAVIAMAHRGGVGHPEIPGAENSLHAFRHATALGYTYLETDVHATSDGTLLAFHDAVLDRVTDGTGRLDRLRADQVARARIGGEHAVPRMAELLEELPGARFNIDLKSAGAVGPLVELIEHTGAHDRVCIGSFGQRRLDRFRALTHGRVATSASPAEVAVFAGTVSGRLARLLTRGRVAALQVPHRRGPVPVVTRGFVRRAHAAGAQVHVWTVDEAPEMEELLDLGVDGLITDRTDVCRDVLRRRGAWRDPA
ncbi:glycerophosphodiester phosphodiesterase [Nocardioides aurantiacus]|uniref:Glycerophosphoryl diester phosphodiesterase n=1 Tax=Nocardioides aurantiacus TaxID=86796 RepID=A0A3N2CT71_9ACTN|nr:glycerophosphodiester phosphodiesterase [Nocardioides aurantiacus]ROR90742.1 glycerophosphoryl diester phosphodiesterase [Nocardioides aurantiacus]